MDLVAGQVNLDLADGVVLVASVVGQVAESVDSVVGRVSPASVVGQVSLALVDGQVRVDSAVGVA